MQPGPFRAVSFWMIVLAGDVGGTNARLAVVEIDERRAVIHEQATYPSPAFPGLGPIIEHFLGETGARVDRACFGVPGPVVDGRVRTPNLAWSLDAREVATLARLHHVLLINDFTAVGYGVGWLGPDDLVTLRPGEARPFGQQLLIGAGTGMGVAFRVHDGTRWHVVASEGGHALFAPRTEVEWALARWLRERYQHPSWERVVSGPGLVNVYRFLAESGGTESSAVRELMTREDPAAVISTLGASCGDPLCRRALELFLGAYGAAAGDYAVIGVASGGVFLAGGIAPRLVAMLKDGPFIEGFLGTGNQRVLAERMPLHVIVRGDAGVIGAAAVALESEVGTPA